MWIRSHVQYLKRKLNSLCEEKKEKEQRIRKAKIEVKVFFVLRKEIPEDLNFVRFWSLRVPLTKCWFSIVSNIIIYFGFHDLNTLQINLINIA